MSKHVKVFRMFSKRLGHASACSFTSRCSQNDAKMAKSCKAGTFWSVGMSAKG